MDDHTPLAVWMETLPHFLSIYILLFSQRLQAMQLGQNCMHTLVGRVAGHLGKDPMTPCALLLGQNWTASKAQL